MAVQTRSFLQILRQMVVELQTALKLNIDFSPGSVFRSLLEANAAVAIWMQALVLQVLQTTRAATATADDLDSWMADYSLARRPAGYSSGVVTFSRIVTGVPVVIPPETRVRTSDGGIEFVTSIDTGNTYWDNQRAAFILPANVTGLDVPVVASISGDASNVSAGTITQLLTPLAGVDSVTNANPTSGGTPPETDEAFRERFTLYVASRSRATRAAVDYAIDGVQSGLRYVTLENIDTIGATRVGHFTIFVCDENANASPAIVSAVHQAVEQVRPIGTSYFVLPAAVEEIDISISVLLTADALRSECAERIRAAIYSYVRSLDLGATVYISRLVSVCYQACSDLVAIQSLTVNGTAENYQAGRTSALKSGVIDVG